MFNIFRQMNPVLVRKVVDDPPKILGKQQRVTVIVVDIRSCNYLWHLYLESFNALK